MIDAPDRKEERFPPRKENVVREGIAAQLTQWNVGAGDLAICGGARGADLLVAELAAEMAAEVWLLLPLPESEFLQSSVHLPGSNWVQRYFGLRRLPGVKAFQQSDSSDALPEGASVFERNNVWMVNTAQAEVGDPKNLFAVVVWDEKPAGDGPGGTADCVSRIKHLGGTVAIINPTKL
jgi:hypothetical protein